MTASQSSSLIRKSRLSRMIPAQVTRMSTEPRSAVAATAASTSSREVTSQRTAVPPISPAVACAVASSKSATTTCAPSAARRRAVAAPMPFAPPVTSAFLPWNLMRPSLTGLEQRAAPDLPGHRQRQLRDELDLSRVLVRGDQLADERLQLAGRGHGARARDD